MKLTRSITRILLAAGVLALLVACVLPVRAEDSPSETDAWKKLDGAKVSELQDYLKSFPDGLHAGDARLLITLQNRLAEIREGKRNPLIVIPIPPRPGEQTSDNNGLSITFRPAPDTNGVQTVQPEADLIGVAFTKIPVDPRIGVLAFRPCGKGRGTVRIGSSGPELPREDGAIFAIKTYGMNTRDVLRKLDGNEMLFGGLQFQTPDVTNDFSAPEGTIYFGVIPAKGLVYLYGNGKAILPDGHEVELKEKTD